MFISTQESCADAQPGAECGTLVASVSSLPCNSIQDLGPGSEPCLRPLVFRGVTDTSRDFCCPLVKNLFPWCW